MPAKVTPAFTKAYNSLNMAQKQAVDTINGPVMVVAGPGTGKTQVLALRIAQILKETDTPPNGILALTFTEAGVYAMRTRLVSLIGTAAYHVRIHTFHSFCNSIIQEHPHQFDRLIGATHIAEIDSITTLRECIDELGEKLTKLRKFGDPYFFVTDIKSEISTLKREAISSDELEQRVKKEVTHIEESPDCIHTKGAYKGKMKAEYVKRLDSLARTLELATIYRAYTKALEKKRLYDFDDMILETIIALQNNADFLQIIQEQFLYILADEHQDANTAQNTLLTLLTAYDTNPNLFLVGDDKQAIFSFQGASLAHFRGFKDAFPKAVEVTLTDSYRSGAKILDASHALMAVSPEHGKRNAKLTSKLAEPHLATLEYREYTTEEHERVAVVKRIEKLIGEGVDPREIAVIYRNNRDAAPISTALHKEGIAHSVVSNVNVLDNHTIAQFITYLKAVSQWGNDTYFARALHAPFLKVSEYDIYRIMLLAKRHGETAFGVCNEIAKIRLKNTKVRPLYADEMKNVDIEHVASAFNSMQTLADNLHTTDARTLFDRAVRESGFLQYILRRGDAHELLACLRGVGQTLDILAKSRADYTLPDFMHDLDLFTKYNLRVEKDDSLVPKRGVQLMTAHKSKGLEFSYVFILHCRDKKWGNTRSMHNFVIPGLEVAGNDNEDERRLLYVAITRAKLMCSISVGLQNAEGGNQLPSSFITELGEHIVHTDTTDEEAAYLPQHTFIANTPPATPLFDTDFLRAQFIEQGLSATALNNYILCPWKYFYKNLVRLPEPPSPASLFGNSVHAALNSYFADYARTEAQPKLEFLLDAFEADLPKQGFFKQEKDEALKRGKESLTAWYAVYGVLEGSLVGTEQNVQVKLDVGGSSNTVLLRGIIDRLVETRSGDLVVTDFKTGKPKTRGEIQGSTKNSNGDYKRQLEFYKLLLKESAQKYLTYAQIEFVEPDTKGNPKREVFTSSELDADALKQKIAEIAEEIYTFAFWGRDCGDKECEYCLLRKQMQ